MIQTLNKHVKWRQDRSNIFICDCKRLIDLKISFEYLDFMKNLSSGIDKKELEDKEKKVFSDFEKMNLLAKLEVRQLKEKDFQKAMDILDRELGKNRVRGSSFLFERFKEYPRFFIGIFLNEEITGVICGFPREDYLLMSEIAVDSRFIGREFGKKLVEKFEQSAYKSHYSKIHIGARDNAIEFYSLMSYRPFLLVQFEPQNYSLKDFRNFDIIKATSKTIEIKVREASLNKINKLRKKYPNAYFQYIFTKNLKQMCRMPKSR